MVRAESINIAKNLVAQGKTAGEIWSFFSSFDPETLDLYWKTPRRNITEFIETCAKTLPLQQPVVDVGCGERSYKPEITDALGLDVHYIALDHWIRNSCVNRSRLLNLVGKAENIPLLDESAGTVICSEVLEHVNDDQKTVREMYRILKAEGRLVLTLPGRDIPKHEKLPYQIDYRRYGLGQTREILSNCGFLDIQINEKYLWELQINILVVAKK
ncbi:hypothetical protein COV89_02445 [Candidatus Shapirobacteria bacterium CG11_big_fil_rev_8_21_14_0_20_40_12]|uniref:Methyltransferase type 11 domain-containing protein n=1 Tax=Candidatus Shapirobacteria bacterium CG11_big_fil_rev_8_21_14_0_20_40_12 TaxID=1974889 RepID=A0A2H0KFQ6_9BACT|nr:MAG: hypothetical protein COV89_02445 [Candidatus Shapirobacteria bacterium CG11_big_fil_rev_8_21_14_0_20_40_12]